MKYTYSDELFSEVYEESKPLTERHHEQINLFDEPLDVHVELLCILEGSQSLRTYVIRDESKAMVGYCIFLIYNPTHHKTSVHAKQDVLFIDEQHRGIGLSFIKYCDQQLKELGVKRVHHCVPEINDWSKVLDRLGYTKTETLYTRRL